MRSYSASELTWLQSRSGYKARVLLWMQPRHRTTGARVRFGFWTGEDDTSITIGGVARTYQGGGAILGIDPIVMQAGLGVRMQRAVLSPLHAGVAAALRAHDAWRAPVEIHRAFFRLDREVLLSEPRLLWRGVVDQAPIQTPAIGGDARAELTLASAAIALTKGLTLVRSDAIQSQRGGDRFYKYKDVSGQVTCSWGEKRK